MNSPLTPAQFAAFDFLTTHGQRLAAMRAGGPRLAMLAVLGTDLLLKHAEAAFPQEFAHVRKTLEEVKKRPGAAATSGSARERMKIEGPKLWAEMHPRALKFDPAQAREERRWLRALARRLPCGECRSFYRQYLQEHRPNLTSAESYFAWTVDLHNAVREKLGDAPMSLEEARSIWAPA